MPDIIQELFQIDATFTQDLTDFLQRFGLFTLLIVGSFIIGQLLPFGLRLVIRRFTSEKVDNLYRDLVLPLRSLIVNTGILVSASISLNLFRSYGGFYDISTFFTYLALTISTSWLASKLVSQSLRLYGIQLIRQLGGEVDDFVLLSEAVANAIIVFVATLAFAQSQDLNIISVLTGLGIGGVAIAFAAKETISQIIGTILIYLDRPYVAGEYIRVNFKITDDDTYGRVESIGIRSTKIRVAGKNTLVIVPNSVMVTKDIENISRGNKVMALLYLNFKISLSHKQEALVKETTIDSISGLLGVEPLSTRVFFFTPEDRSGTRARVTFFLLSSSQDSLDLRKRLVTMANQSIKKNLDAHNLTFSIDDPMLYVDSPITK